MLNNNEMFKIANWFIKNKLIVIDDEELIINLSQVFNEGILFSYQSKKYVIDQEENYEIIGGTRFIVDRYNGELFRNISPVLANDQVIKLFVEKKLDLFIKIHND